MQVRWSYGVHLLSQADPVAEDTAQVLENVEVHGAQLESSPLLSGESSDSSQILLYKTECAASSPVKSAGSDTESICTDAGASVFHKDTWHANGGHRDTSHVFHSFPNTPARSLPRLSTTSSPSTLYSLDEDAEDPGSNAVLPAPAIGDLRRHSGSEITFSRFQSGFRHGMIRAKKVLLTVNAFMTVPLWAAAASIIVALIQPLQYALDVHVQWIKGSLSAAGDCSIPLTLVVLGAYFYTPSETPTDDQGMTVDGESGNTTVRSPNLTQAKGYGSFMNNRCGKLVDGSNSQKAPRPGETRAVIIAVASRMFVTPLVLLPLIWRVARMGVFPIFDE